MEIERKFLPKYIPDDLSSYECLSIEQAYLNRSPVVRIRKENDLYYLTYKGKGFLVREESNLPLTEESYRHLLEKADGNVLRKLRYRIPFEENGKEYIIELDRFLSPEDGLYLAEVEFESEEEARSFIPPEWFSDDVTDDPRYSNAYIVYSRL